MEASGLAGQWRSLAERFRRIADNDCSESHVRAAAAIAGALLPTTRQQGLQLNFLEPTAAELQEHAGQADVIATLWATCWLNFVAVISHPRINPGFPIPNPLVFKTEYRGGLNQITVGGTNGDDWRIRAENYAAICDMLADEAAAGVALGIGDTPYPHTIAQLVDRIDATLAEVNGPEAAKTDPAWWSDVWELAKGHCYRIGAVDAIADAGRLAPENLIIPDWSSPAARAIRDGLRKRLVELRLKITGQSASGAENGAGDDPARPKQYLSNWREILDALEMPNNVESKNRVRELNKSYAGPIALPSRGGQPKVEKTKLIEWWNDLENRFAESDQRIRDRDATVAATHNYGRDGTVAPNIGGSIKRRRSS